MVTTAPDIQHTFERRVFQGWSVALPVDMEETFIADDGYWHAWSDDRSISLSSIMITDRRGAPIPALDILDRVAPIDGEPVPLPNELPGWARSIDVSEGRADHAISGMLVVDGNVLLITVTSDDHDWNRWVWRSIKHHRHAERRRRH